MKNIILFALPLMVMNLLQMMFNAADSIIVGKFAGENYLAAVGVTASLIFLFVSLFQGLATGTNVVVAREIGAGGFRMPWGSVAVAVVCVFLVVFVSMLYAVSKIRRDNPVETLKEENI